MKLRNKKTGEIIETQEIYENVVGEIRIRKKAEEIDSYEYTYNSLAELNEEWEDYEEPKEYWFISTTGKAHRFEGEDKTYTPDRKQLGNCFETREEAEKAVEKLKAWKRLNKCEFRFEGYNNRDRANGGDIVIYAHVDIPNNNLLEEAQPAMLADLDLLFSGEDD